MALPAHVDEDRLASRLDRFRIETPSWGYADTGTRFGKFFQAAAATSIEEKLADAGQVHQYTGCCDRVAVHVLWDFAPDSKPEAVAALAHQHGLRLGSINPNLFQDQCYKFGSLTNRDPDVRSRAMGHVRDCIEIGAQVKSELLSLWLADGSNYPGQVDLRQRWRWLGEALAQIHAALPESMQLLIEYKPFEPAFYHTDIPDWGAALQLAQQAGERASVLLDTGHHLPGANIEQIVALLIETNRLGGFHFNDRKYADDDLTLGSIDPYQVYRVFFEIAWAEQERGADLDIAYMIDQSHNLKPKIEAMIQTVLTAQELFTKAQLLDWTALRSARQRDDVVDSEAVLRDAFATDVRPFLAEYRRARSLPPAPLEAFRESGYAPRIAAERAGRGEKATSSYA
ncbi:MAG: TIM barrel protein [Phycisphaerales bacterium JB038]